MKFIRGRKCSFLPPKNCSRSISPSHGRVSNEGSIKSKAEGEGASVGMIRGVETGRGLDTELRPTLES